MIRIKKQGKIVYRESKVFARHHSAVTWAKRREVELEDPVVLARAQAGKRTLTSLIPWYIDTFRTLSNWQQSKPQSLEFLERHKIGEEDAYKLTVRRLVRHIRARHNDGARPATVSVDLTYIAVVLEAAKVIGGFPANPTLVEEARGACQRLGLIAPANKREVRPTGAQLIALDNHFRNRSARATIPMADIMWLVGCFRSRTRHCRSIEAGRFRPHKLGILLNVTPGQANESFHTTPPALKRHSGGRASH